jgi:hypothetical protein
MGLCLSSLELLASWVGAPSLEVVIGWRGRGRRRVHHFRKGQRIDVFVGRARFELVVVNIFKFMTPCHISILCICRLCFNSPAY